MKAALLVGAASLLVLGGLAGLAAWRSAHPDERTRELRWLDSYAEWSARIDAGLAGGDYAPGVDCEETYATAVGVPPDRLADASRIALAGCRRLRHAIAGSDLHAGSQEWYSVRGSVLADLTDRRSRVAAPDTSAELAARAAPFAGTDPVVYCWSSTHWDELSEEWRRVRVDELWPIGFADQAGDRIHLAPQICDPLHRFFGGNYAPNLNVESYELAIALVTLAHEAEHLRSPESNEAEVECVAIQRVRDLVRASGRPKAYENLMAGLAWDVGYPDVPPEYKTDECRDGSALDVRPATSVWP